MSKLARTPVRKKAKELAENLRLENPDYDYLELFRHLRRVIWPRKNGHLTKPPFAPQNISDLNSQV
jgi:hypothetical protein